MSAKKSWSPIKEMLFTYLAITKILYWVNTIAAMNQNDLGSAGEAVLMRLINQDAMLIVGVVAFYFLDKRIALKKSKYSSILEYVIFYAVGYVVLMGIAFVYNAAMGLIFSAQYFSWGEFVSAFIGFLPGVTLGYLAVVVIFEIKHYFKKKTAPGYEPPAKSAEDKLAMLKILLDDGVLTQEEFDCKKGKLMDAAAQP
ncbi:MAG: SHOCT domain-containing protein [Defluviitaleaceae bacterium]|nr:SHOCT domain-containing protein [Defluviitaleaceae bacterium]